MTALQVGAPGASMPRAPKFAVLANFPSGNVHFYFHRFKAKHNHDLA